MDLVEISDAIASGCSVVPVSLADVGRTPTYSFSSQSEINHHEGITLIAIHEVGLTTSKKHSK